MYRLRHQKRLSADSYYSRVPIPPSDVFRVPTSSSKFRSTKRGKAVGSGTAAVRKKKPETATTTITPNSNKQIEDAMWDRAKTIWQETMLEIQKQEEEQDRAHRELIVKAHAEEHRQWNANRKKHTKQTKTATVKKSYHEKIIHETEIINKKRNESPPIAPPIQTQSVIPQNILSLSVITLDAAVLGISVLKQRNHAHELANHGRYKDAADKYSSVIHSLERNGCLIPPSIFINRAICNYNCGDYHVSLSDGLKAAELDCINGLQGQYIAARAYLIIGNFKSANSLVSYLSKVAGSQYLHCTAELLELTQAFEIYNSQMSRGNAKEAFDVLSDAGPEPEIMFCRLKAQLEFNPTAVSNTLSSLKDDLSNNPIVLFLKAKSLFRCAQDCISISTAKQLLTTCEERDCGKIGSEAKQLRKTITTYESLRSSLTIETASRRLHKSLDLCSEILQLDPGNIKITTSTLVARASLYRSLRQYNNEIDDFTKVITLEKNNPHSYKWYLSRATARQALHEWDDAISDAEKASQLSKSPVARTVLLNIKLQAAAAASKSRPLSPPPTTSTSSRGSCGRDDFYIALGANRSDSPTRITSLYRKKALQWHPDKWASSSQEEQKHAEDQFKIISEAYNILCDARSRRRYDLKGSMGRGEQRKVPKPPPQPKKPKQRRPVDGCDNRDKHSSLFDTEVFSIAVQPHEKLIASDEQRRLEEPIQTERPKKRKSGRRRNSNNGKNPRGRNRTESRSRDDSGFATPVSFSISVGVQTEETCFTKEQCSNLSSDYIIISDHIYDVGEFNHPGGREALSDFDGKNATSVFENSHQINHHILDTLSSLWVGQITPEISIAKKKKKRIKLKMSKQPPEPTVKKEKVWELEYDPESHGIPIFVMTVGIPGSGKSTWASHQTGYEIISSDDIRKELTGSLGLTTKEELIWNTVWNRISAALLFGKSVILDSTNTISNHRSRLLASLPPCVSYSKVFLSTPELSKRRIDEDIARGRCRSEVPYPAILKMYKQLNRDLHLLQSDGFPPLCDDEDEEECQYYTNK